MPSRLVLLFAFFILLLAGCAAPQADLSAATGTPTPANMASTATFPVAVATMQPQPAVTETPTATFPPTPAPTETPAAAPENSVILPANALEGPVQAYSNRSARFAMELPADWQIIDISQQINATRMYTVSVNSPMQPRGPKQQEGLLPGESKMDINVNPSEQPMDYETAVDYWRGSILGGEFPAKILEERSGLLPSGLRATRWLIESERGGTVAWTLVEINNDIVNFVGMGDLDLTDRITGTVRTAE